jgi:hypothetical protein
VVYDPGPAAADSFGLLAYEIEPSCFRGFYTPDRDRLEVIGREIRTRM